MTTSAGAGGATRRRPRWPPTLAAFVAIALFVTAGNWQHRRMLEKEALQQRIDAAVAMPRVALPAAADWSAWRFRQVEATGVYDAAHQILIDNQVHGGRVGFEIVTPLALRDGRVVLVDRGFAAAGESRSELPSSPPPAGEVTVKGRVDIPARRYFELGKGNVPEGVVWQHLDPARFAKTTGIDVLPFVIDVEAGEQGMRSDAAGPDLDVERNRSYMLQWYAFAAIVAALWAKLTLMPFLRLRHGSS